MNDRSPSCANVEAQFRDAIRAAGLATDDPIHADGKLHRFRVQGDKRGARNGWYVLHADGIPAGEFGCWKRGISQTWCANIGRELTAVERDEQRRQLAETQRQREAELARQREETRRKAARLWKEASRRVRADHPYLVAKGVRAYGLRQLKAQLVVPVRDASGALHGLQFIGPNGSKKFLTGTAKTGHYHALGKPPRPGDVLALAEGYATGATVHALTGWAVAVAFDAGNLRSAAEALRAKYPQARIVLAADNDRGTDGNPGLSAAQEAARSVGGLVIAPEFDAGEPGSDWNDLAAARGADAARETLFRGAEACPTPAPGAAQEAAEAPAGAEPGADQTTAEQTPAPRSHSRKPRADFKVNERGLFWHGITNEGEPLPPQYIGPPIFVRARLRDEEESNWGRLVEFNDARGTPHRWALPSRILVKREEVMSELLRQGYEFAATNPNQTKLLEYLGRPCDAPFARSVERTGWHGRVYVLPDRIIGEPPEPLFFQAETLLGNVYRCRGELGDWKSDVADLCRGNSRLVFAVSAAFAAILLSISGDESGGFHYRGGSSSGKTTALRVAASVYGGTDYLRRWRATDNALEAVAAMHNDALLILDELAQVDPKTAGAAAYMLGNGEGKQRAFKNGTARPVLCWRLLFLSAGEVSLAEHMRQDGKRAQAGQEARLAEIPADAGAGLGVFENLHGYPDGAAFSRALLTAAAERHGTAAQAFIAALQPQFDALPTQLRQKREAFFNKHLPPGADGQARRVAQRFALVAAAGELASEYGITGWEPGEAERAAAVCFAAWIEQRGGAGNVEPARMLAQVRHFLEQHGESRFQPWTLSEDERTRWTTNKRAGFRLGAESSFDTPEITYFVLPEVFREEVCAGFDYRDVLRALDAAGALKRDKASRKYTRRERLPGLGLAQCYVILPAIWKDAEATQGDEAPQQRASDSAGTAGTAGTG